MAVDQRLCESCNVVEDECHVIMHCSLYDDIRTQIFTEINTISDHFPTLSTDVQFLQINNNASKPHISKMHNVQETQKTVSKQTRNREFATSIFAIFIDFAFEF